MTAGFRRILERYGQTVTVHGVEARAFFQPICNKAEGLPFQVGPMGTADDRQWRYLGPAEVRPGDTVAFQQRRFTVQNSQAVCLGGQVCHWWAVLTPEREEAEM